MFLRTKKIFLILIILLFCGVCFTFPGFAEIKKEYRKGEIVYINNKDYLIASNKQFIEILEITPDDKLIQVSEVHGMSKVNDLYVSHERENIYLIVATGRYLIKYDISNPFFPEIIIKRDLYAWKRGKYRIGYISSLVGNDNYLFVAGTRGVRRFVKENLFVDKFYTFKKSYGIAVNNDKLAVLEKDKGLIFDIKSGDLEGEYEIENIKNNRRRPEIDYFNNVYFPSDNSLIKVASNNIINNKYYNPVKPGIIHSYAVDVLPRGEIFYVNGYGVTKLDNSLNKVKFFYSAPSHIYGPNSWAVGIEAKGIKQGERIAVFNKSSIFLLDNDLNLLFQYKYTPLYNNNVISTELKIVPSRYFGIPPNDSIDLTIYGYWPNEEVEVMFGSNKYLVKVNNLGYGKIRMKVPEMEKGTTTVIVAKGKNSGLSYQTTFKIK